jgi:hypothetical protein
MTKPSPTFVSGCLGLCLPQVRGGPGADSL